MKPRLRTVLVVLSLLSAPAAFASPRTVIDEAATMIENNYFDATRARRIAGELRTEAAAGKYDKLTDVRDLTSALTRRLQPLDHHFNVTWRPASEPAATAPRAAAPAPADGRGALETRWILEARRAQQSTPAGPPLAEYAGAYAGATVSVSHGHLQLERGRRPNVELTRLKGDMFFVSGEPFRRALFERDGAGRVKGFQYCA